MTRGNVTYQFLLAVRRGEYFRIANDERFDAASRALAGIADTIFDNGSVYMQFISSDAGVTTYFFDNKLHNNIKFGMAAAASVGIMATDFMLSSKGARFPEVFTYSAMLAVPFIAATTGPGIVRRKRRVPDSDLWLKYEITGRQYKNMQAELKGAGRKQNGEIYQILMNNCSSYALRFASRHGLEVPSICLPTPRKLANKIEEMIL
jgi:hypothetical protein